MHKRMGAQDRGAGGKLGIGRRARLALPFLAVLILLLAAAPAQASFHLIKVREIFPGTTARPNSDYVELQMYAAGQSLVHFGELEVLNSAGAVVSNFTPASNVTNSANQSTVLIADSEFTSQFPGHTADFEDAALDLSPSGGAVCWPQTEPPFDDCASWGDFSGKAFLPTPGDSAPAVAIPNGMALLRSIAPGCATLLENGDDTNNSSVDFSAASPAPRGNGTTPVEHECAALPNTVIDAKPANPTKATVAGFTYHSVPAGAEFECSLDGAAFADCATSGIEYPGPLSQGSHSFEVQAVNEAGADSTPATYSWVIDTTPPQAEIKSHPTDPSPGNSAAFTYGSKEVGSTFQCSLERAGEADDFSPCPSTGKTYPDAGHPGPLANGDWTFKVVATDKAGNEGPAAEFGWEVNSGLADETPPETTIDSRPPDPSASSTAAFTYSANEAGSSFQCQLDGAGFSACPAGGISYSGLGNGPHSFQVRAIDSSGNIDLSPAGYSFEVVLGSAAPVPSLPTPVPLPTPARRPNTAISGKGGTRTHDRTPTFRFGSGSAGATFQCKLDHGPFKACRSPLTTKTLAYGGHLLQVRAILDGATDPTPAKLAFKVVKP
jgi:hypothetical protein